MQATKLGVLVHGQVTLALAMLVKYYQPQTMLQLLVLLVFQFQ